MVRPLFRRVFKAVHLHRLQPYTDSDLCRTAVVFSPHFDDEVLGCGGTIIKKKRAGADVKIVFMTDGSKSHRHMMAEDKLSEIRSREGVAAGVAMGLDPSDVIRLNFEETRLNQHEDEAVRRVAEVLAETQPQEIFLPYFGEPLLWSHDHVFTNRVVLTAIDRVGCSATVYEYPIWFWSYWPWATLPVKSIIGFLRLVKHSTIADWRLFRDLTCSVYIGDVLQEKRNALEQHESQMTRLIPDRRWKTLGEVANGEFLPCFFQEHELFFKRPRQRGQVVNQSATAGPSRTNITLPIPKVSNC